MADKRRNRGTQAHAGVVLKARKLPSGATSYRARFTDPDTGAEKWETLPAEATTEEQRRAWAVGKAGQLAERRRELVNGGARKTGAALDDLVAAYFTESAARLRNRTLEGYRGAARILTGWLKAHGVDAADGITPAHLNAFRGSLFTSGRGGRRTAATVITLSKQVGTLLDWLRRHGATPLLSSDAIADAFPLETVGRPVPKVLSVAELRRIADAAITHDLTGDSRVPATAYTVLLALTGMRASELRCLLWDRVSLVAGSERITLTPADTKTKAGRVIDLTISPLAVDILKALQVRATGARVFGATAETTTARARADFGVIFKWKDLRSTCATYLANSNIWGGASTYRESRQLGHSVKIAEAAYLGLVNVDRDARTIDDLLGLTSMRDVILHAVGAA